jgi:hypothetical protein
LNSEPKQKYEKILTAKSVQDNYYNNYKSNSKNKSKRDNLNRIFID